MKLSYKLSGLDCANCAAKLERAIDKIKIVDKVSISFMSQVMVIEADERNCDAVLGEAVKVASKLMPKVNITRR